jgi:hypothetical protein
VHREYRTAAFDIMHPRVNKVHWHSDSDGDPKRTSGAPAPSKIPVPQRFRASVPSTAARSRPPPEVTRAPVATVQDQNRSSSAAAEEQQIRERLKQLQVERKEALSRLNNNIGVTATAAVEEPPEAVSEETPTHPLDEQQLAWLGAHGLGGSTAADMRARQFVHRAEADVAGDASAAAWQCCDLLTAAQPPDESELFDESVLDCAAAANAARRAAAAAARAQLTDLGVVDEHLALEPSALLPSIHEMAFARHVGSTVAAGLQRPPAGSFGKEYQWPACVGASTPPPPDTTLAMLVISRYEEDVGWLLRRLPPRVDYHVVQLAGRLQEELPRTKQTVLPIAPAASAAAGEAAAAARGAAATTATGLLLATRRRRRRRRRRRQPPHARLSPGAARQRSSPSSRRRRSARASARRRRRCAEQWWAAGDLRRAMPSCTTSIARPPTRS